MQLLGNMQACDKCLLVLKTVLNESRLVPIAVLDSAGGPVTGGPSI